VHELDLGEGARVLFSEGYVQKDLGLLKGLRSSLPLKTETLRFAGKDVPMPRLTSWHGDIGYRYSGKLFQPSPWTDELSELRNRLNVLLDVEFNSVLVNYYRDGKDSIAWHADDEPEIEDGAIASVSLGAPRRFILKHKTNSTKHEYMLGNGSLLVMCNAQKTWLHSVPKTAKPVGPRMNLTYRVVRPKAF